MKKLKPNKEIKMSMLETLREKNIYQCGWEKGFDEWIYETLKIVKKGAIVSVDENPFIVTVIRNAEEAIVARIKKELL